MNNALTDRLFWSNYWESKLDLAVRIEPNYLFHQQLLPLIKHAKPDTAIELGGFPGYYSIFLKKYFAIDTTLFDFFVHQGILNKVLAKNGLDDKDVSIIEADLFHFTPSNQYDLVLSCGLIEHFIDTQDVLAHHVKFLKPGGSLFVTLPNFRGVNGWIQRVFDRDNYQKHHIHCMDVALLRRCCHQLGLKNVQVNYTGRFSVWLEHKEQKSWPTRLLVKTIWYLGKLITKLVPFESKCLSPYLVIKAEKAN
mgnify:FL=1